MRPRRVVIQIYEIAPRTNGQDRNTTSVGLYKGWRFTTETATNLLISRAMSSSDRLITAFGAFVGGLALGMLFAPISGNRTRRIARFEAHRSSRWLGTRLKSTQQRIVEAGDDAADHVRKAAADAVDRYLPDVVGDDDAWQEAYSSTMKDVEDEKR